MFHRYRILPLNHTGRDPLGSSPPRPSGGAKPCTSPYSACSGGVGPLATAYFMELVIKDARRTRPGQHPHDRVQARTTSPSPATPRTSFTSRSTRWPMCPCSTSCARRRRASSRRTASTRPSACSRPTAPLTSGVFQKLPLRGGPERCGAERRGPGENRHAAHLRPHQAQSPL